MKQAKKQLRRNLTPDDLQAIGDVVYDIVDKQVATLATKQDLSATKQGLKEEITASELRLKAYMHEGFEAVMHGMDNLAGRFVEKEEFVKLVEWARIVGEKVGVKPKL